MAEQPGVLAERPDVRPAVRPATRPAGGPADGPAGPSALATATALAADGAREAAISLAGAPLPGARTAGGPAGTPAVTEGKRHSHAPSPSAPAAAPDRETAESTVTDTPAMFDVFLGPGDLYFGDRTTRIRTLLGSCVAVTLWHPRARIGGMCHYVVPTRHDRRPHHELSGHYADEAIEMLFDEIRATATRPQEYQVKMFGGGSQFTGIAMDVAARNVEVGLELLASHHLHLMSMHFGGTGHRQVVLDIGSGDVWLRHVELAKQGART